MYMNKCMNRDSLTRTHPREGKRERERMEGDKERDRLERRVMSCCSADTSIFWNVELMKTSAATVQSDQSFSSKFG